TGKLYTLWFLAFKLPFQAWRQKSSLVHTRNLASAWGSIRVFGMDTVLELHDIPENNKNTLRMLSGVVSSSKLKFIICITHALALKVREIVGDFVKIHVLPDGVSVGNLKFIGSKDELKRTLNISNKFTCVYTGSLYRGKG